jgi:dTDP-4-amino-4,6-dideoxygalactose transaminase
MPQILMNDFTSEPPELKQQMLEAADRVFRSGRYILGPEVERFERLWAGTCGVAHAVGVGNGMDAIEIALRSLDLGPDDEVITTPTTAFATVLAVLRAGAKPVLADIDPETALLSPEAAERCVTRRTRALLLVHLYGQLHSLQRWKDWCESQGIDLIEDCAQAHYATWKGKSAGAFGRVSAFSFYPTKNLGAIGDAGLVLTAEAGLADVARRLRNYGETSRYCHPYLGLNSRLDELQAAILSERLTWLAAFTARRRSIASIYRRELNNGQVRLLAAPQESGAHVYHLFVVTSERRDALQAHLHSHGVQTAVHYPLPVHLQESCRDISRDPQGLAASEAHAATCLSLPCHPQMTDLDVQLVIDAVNSFGGH